MGTSTEDGVAQQPPQSPTRLIHLLSNTRLLAALFGTVIESAVRTSFDSTLPLFVLSTFGWGATGAGFIFLALILPSLMGPMTGWLSDKYGPKWPATAGLLMATPLLVCLGFVTDNSRPSNPPYALLGGIGLSLTFVFGPLMAGITWAIQADSDDSSVEPYAMTYGMHNTAFSIGGILGPVMGGYVRDRLGWPTMGLMFAAASLLGAVVQLLWAGGPLKLRAGPAS